MAELDRFADVLDPEVVAWEMAKGSSSFIDDPVALEARRRHYGARAAEAPGAGLFVGGVGLVDGELHLPFVTWSGIATGFPALLGWLSDGGCHNMRAAFVDFDDVRGD